MYYMIKVDSQYPSEYANIIMINKIYGNEGEAELKYVSVSSYEYTGDGTGCFSDIGDRWQTNRGDKYPFYMIFESDIILNRLSFISGQGLSFCVKNFSIFKSEELLSYTDIRWKHELSAIASQTSELQHFYLSENYYLLNSNNQIYNIKDSTYNVDTGEYNSINRNNEQSIKEFYKLNTINFKDLFMEKNLNAEKFRPIDKFDKFNIKKLYYKNNIL